MVNLFSKAAKDLSSYDDLMKRFEIEQRQLQFHEDDLLSHQEDLKRHSDFLLRLQEDSRRHAESVRRLYEDNQRHSARIRSIEGIMKSSLFKSLGSKQPAPIQMIGPMATEEKRNSCEASDSEEGKFDNNEVDCFAAKSLIDLSTQTQNDEAKTPPNSLVPYIEADEKQKEPSSPMNLGCRFQPTDQELIACLHKKVAGQPVPDFIKEKNLYGSEEPQDIFKGITASELYFFTLIKNKFDSGKKIDRIVGNGTWKIQNKKPIYEDPLNKSGTKIGFKKTLNFIDHSGDQENKNKISWIMHEYVLNVASSTDDHGRWAICRVKRGRGNRFGLEPSFSVVPEPIPVSSKRPMENDADVELQMPQKKFPKVSNESGTSSNSDLPVQKPPVPVQNPLLLVEKSPTNGALSEQEKALRLALAPPSLPTTVAGKSVPDIP